MYRIKALRNYGEWFQQGETYDVANYRADHLVKSGHAQIIKYLGCRHCGSYARDKKMHEMLNELKYVKIRISSLENQIKAQILRLKMEKKK